MFLQKSAFHTASLMGKWNVIVVFSFTEWDNHWRKAQIKAMVEAIIQQCLDFGRQGQHRKQCKGFGRQDQAKNFGPKAWHHWNCVNRTIHWTWQNCQHLLSFGVERDNWRFSAFMLPYLWNGPQLLLITYYIWKTTVWTFENLYFTIFILPPICVVRSNFTRATLC